VPYEEQLAGKRRALVEALGALVERDDVVAATIPSPHLRGYRNQARLVFRRMSRGGAQHVGLGLYLPGTHRVVHIPSCPIQPGRMNAVAASVTQLAEQLDVSVYDERVGEGALRYLAIRTDRTRKHHLVTIIVGEDPGPPLRRLAEQLRARHPEIVGVLVHVNSRHSNVLFAGEDAWTLGSDRLEDEVGRFRVFVSPRSFLQVNAPQAEWIYARLERELVPGPAAGGDPEVEPRETVLDLYCGIGGIALHLARPGRLVVGVEESAEAVEDARRAAHANGVAGVRFVAARVEDFLAEPARYGADFERLPVGAAVLNPPRVGCKPAVLEALAALGPERIAYVSCRPFSLARDLDQLRGAYALESATPVDMIPLTSHVESLCFLRRREPGHGTA
jgi:23S rRNA (uracil1939-C5)-methyltransferase